MHNYESAFTSNIHAVIFIHDITVFSLAMTGVHIHDKKRMKCGKYLKDIVEKIDGNRIIRNTSQD